MLKVHQNNIKKYVLAIYWLIGICFFIDPFFSTFTTNTTILRASELMVLIAIFFCYTKVLFHNKFARYTFLLKIFILTLVIISVGIVIRGNFSIGLKNILLKFSSPFGFMVYILPIIILPLPNHQYFRSILNALYKLQLFAIPLWIVALFNTDGLVQDTYHGESIGAYFPFISAFLLGFLRLFPKKKQIITILIFTIYLFLMILNARRNVILSLSLYCVAAIFINIVFSAKKYINFIIVISSLICLTTIALNVNFNKLSQGLFSNLVERGFENTRSEVELLFMYDLTNSPTSDLIFGRGMDGTYYQEVEDEETSEVEYDRPVIETGYLHMILKGGIIYVLLIVFIMFVAIFLGIRSKKKYLTFGAIVILLYVIDNYTANPICIFSIRATLFWMCISLIFQHNSIKRYLTHK